MNLQKMDKAMQFAFLIIFLAIVISNSIAVAQKRPLTDRELAVNFGFGFINAGPAYGFGPSLAVGYQFTLDRSNFFCITPEFTSVQLIEKGFEGKYAIQASVNSVGFKLRLCTFPTMPVSPIIGFGGFINFISENNSNSYTNNSKNKNLVASSGIFSLGFKLNRPSKRIRYITTPINYGFGKNYFSFFSTTGVEIKLYKIK